MTLLEKEATQLELKIDQIKEDKQKLIDEISQIQSKSLLWEKKIALEKEMQLALDPNIGKKEIGDLNKELHLKQLELEKLKQAQEKMVQDITKAVNKKDSIELKYGGEKKTGITGKKARPSGV